MHRVPLPRCAPIPAAQEYDGFPGDRGRATTRRAQGATQGGRPANEHPAHEWDSDSGRGLYQRDPEEEFIGVLPTGVIMPPIDTPNANMSNRAVR